MIRFLPLLLLLLLGFTANAQNGMNEQPRIGLNQPSGSTTIRIYCGPPKLTQRPLYVINGRVADSLQLATINPDQINSISIIKPAQSLKLYGDLARNGAVLITTKPAASR